jgi:DNA-binding NtrC family response regulator
MFQFSQEDSYFDVAKHNLAIPTAVLDVITSRREEMLRHWHDVYVLHFREKRTLSETEFLKIAGTDLDTTVSLLREKSVDGFVVATRRIATIFNERKVPFSEVVALMHLFEESAGQFLPRAGRLAAHVALERICHFRTIVLAETYFDSQPAGATARVFGPGQGARQLPLQARSHFYGLVGASPPMHQLYEQIKAAGAAGGKVLIVGESGTGKELVARAIHEYSARARGPFVALNCAALSRELIESELFGYKRGAFSGAAGDYSGLFQSANGGTLFLDEVTEMSPETQSKVLRALQENMVRPVGSTREVPVSARLIASTNRDPEKAVRERQLREDLYYRMQVNQLRVPPLRERLDDIPLLVDHFVALFNHKLNRTVPVTGVEPGVLRALHRYSWPGNVRELSNAIETAFTFGHSQLIQVADLPRGLADNDPTAKDIIVQPPKPSPVLSGFSLENSESNLIRQALAITGGNKSRAAKLLGISRKKLYIRIAKYRLPRLQDLWEQLPSSGRF